MSYRHCDLTIRAYVEPDAVRARVLEAYRASGASLVDAARLLDVSFGTLRGLVERLGLDNQLNAMREAAKTEGWFHGRVGGAPHGKRGKRRAS